MEKESKDLTINELQAVCTDLSLNIEGMTTKKEILKVVQKWEKEETKEKPMRFSFDLVNKSEKVPTLTEEREARCVPAARYLIKLLAAQELLLVGTEGAAFDGPDPYAPTIRAFLQRIIDKDIKVSEITYVFALAKEALDVVQAQIDETMNQQMNRNSESMYGLDHNKFHDVTVKDLNRVVKRRHLIRAAWKPILDAEVAQVPEEIFSTMKI